MRLEEVARFTPDPQRTIEFYEKFLGTKPAAKSSETAEFMLAGVKLFIHKKATKSDLPSPDEDHVAFEVEDVDAACKELQTRGITIDVPPREYYWGSSAYLKDPDGRWLELHQGPKDK